MWVFFALAWLCYYRALQEDHASVVVPIDKLSILVTISFSYFVLHEKLKKQSAIGVIMIVIGTLFHCIKNRIVYANISIHNPICNILLLICHVFLIAMHYTMILAFFMFTFNMTDTGYRKESFKIIF